MGRVRQLTYLQRSGRPLPRLSPPPKLPVRSPAPRAPRPEASTGPRRRHRAGPRATADPPLLPATNLLAHMNALLRHHKCRPRPRLVFRPARAPARPARGAAAAPSTGRRRNALRRHPTPAVGPPISRCRPAAAGAPPTAAPKQPTLFSIGVSALPPPSCSQDARQKPPETPRITAAKAVRPVSAVAPQRCSLPHPCAAS